MNSLQCEILNDRTRLKMLDSFDTSSCVIATQCISYPEFQRISPTTQLALVSSCILYCQSMRSIQWNIYQGTAVASNITVWTRFHRMHLYEEDFIFGIASSFYPCMTSHSALSGRQTNYFTAAKNLILDHLDIVLWRFEVLYTYESGQSSSSMDFVINQPPSNGSCQIDPRNGTTRTLFTVSCLHWLDDDGIEDYTLYSTLEIFSIARHLVFSFPGWTQDRSRKMIIAFSSEPIFRVRLSVERNETSLLNLVVGIRDQFNSIRLRDLLPASVHVDTTEMDHLINGLESSKAELTLNPLLQLLSGRNQNQVGQIFTSIAQELDRRNTRQMSTAASGWCSRKVLSIRFYSLLDGLTITGLFVSPLTKSMQPGVVIRCSHSLFISCA